MEKEKTEWSYFYFFVICTLSHEFKYIEWLKHFDLHNGGSSNKIIEQNLELT